MQHKGCGIRDECLSGAQVAGKAFVAVSLLGLRLAIVMMAAMRHVCHVTGNPMHFHLLLMCLTRRHHHRSQPLQGKADQYGNQRQQSA